VQIECEMPRRSRRRAAGETAAQSLLPLFLDWPIVSVIDGSAASKACISKRCLRGRDALAMGRDDTERRDERSVRPLARNCDGRRDSRVPRHRTHDRTSKLPPASAIRGTRIVIRSRWRGRQAGGAFPDSFPSVEFVSGQPRERAKVSQA
jgi:hypothetical protein